MCAGRSRTLKLLGFQHLHYDARLQADRFCRGIEEHYSSVLAPSSKARSP